MFHKESKSFLIDIQDNGITILKINRPKVKNSMDSQCWIEFKDVLRELEQDSRVRVIILTSSVSGVFISGADITEFMNCGMEKALYSESSEIVHMIGKLRKPVISAISGFAFGGGFEIALASDIRIISESTIFGFPETGLGVIPGMGGTQRLAKVIGMGRAKEIIMAGKNLRAKEALEIGLAMKCVPDDQLLDEAIKVAEKMLKKGPRALSIAKRCIEAAYSTDIETGLFMENLGFCAMMGSEEMKEGTKAFVEKKSANFDDCRW